MNFLAECAKRLDAGEPACDVMREFRERYTTLRCVNVKACLVRNMCALNPEYVNARDELLRENQSEELRDVLINGAKCTSLDVLEALQTLPHRLTENVRQFTISKQELRTCKRETSRRALEKNRCSERVAGRQLLSHARRILACPAETQGGIPELTFALMLATGRRECEILNGYSTFEINGPYSLRFTGQAKKRRSHDTFVIPCLAPPEHILGTLEILRKRQGNVVLSNTETSKKYQSYLSRHIRHSPWNCKRVHSLRGVYTCMAHRLFDWRDYSNAFVAMCILGHSGLTESLVYTPFQLGDDFGDEPHLGAGEFTAWQPAPGPSSEEHEPLSPSSPS